MEDMERGGGKSVVRCPIEAEHQKFGARISIVMEEGGGATGRRRGSKLIRRVGPGVIRPWNPM